MATYTFRENVLRVIAVIGLIAVLLLGAWGIIQLAFFIPKFFAGLGGAPAAPKTETLSASVPAAVVSGQAFPLSWTHTNGSGEYSYSVSYACAEGLSVKAPLPTGALQAVACNTPFNYINATTTTPLVAEGKDKTINASFTVIATKLSSGAVTATASTNTSVAPSAATKPTGTKPVATKPSTPKTTYVSSGRTTNLYGAPDLQVRMTSQIGSVRAGQLVSMQFVIENVGTNVTPQNWSFTASLPYAPVYVYQSQGQQALYPGDKIVYTLSFTAVPQQYGYGSYDYTYGNTYDYYGTYTYPPYSTLGEYNAYYSSQYIYPYGTQQTASVTVDPMNLVWESNESNNYAVTSLSVY